MPLEKRKRKTVKPLWWKPYGFRKQFSFSSRFLRPRSVLALTLSQTKSVHYLPDLWFVPLCILYKVSTTKPDHHGNSIYLSEFLTCCFKWEWIFSTGFNWTSCDQTNQHKQWTDDQWSMPCRLPRPFGLWRHSASDIQFWILPSW